MDPQSLTQQLKDDIDYLRVSRKKHEGKLESIRERRRKSQVSNEARQADIDSEIEQTVQSMDEETLKLIGDLNLEE